MGKLIEDFFSIPIPAQVWHYTNFAGFEGIVSSGTVWATEAHHTTDRSEFVHARKVAIEFLHNLKPEDASDEYAQKTALEIVVYEFDQGVLSPSRSEIFLASFCANDDLASQWKNYGAAGHGLSLSFDMRHVRPSEGIGSAVTFAPCIYETDQKNEMLEDSLLACIGTLSELHRKSGSKEWAMEQLLESVLTSGPRVRPIDKAALFAQNYQQFSTALTNAKMKASFNLLRVASHCKDGSYQPESEWRLSLPRLKAKAIKLEVLHRGPQGIIPYVSHNLFSEKLPIRQVRLGPLFKNEKLVLSLLKQYGHEVPVTRSSN